jgi:branched-chain amino acid transport system ATP-binding protein
MTEILALHGVSKSYGSLLVTDNLTLTLAQGEALGVIGPNGAGKTTMFNLISGNARPDRGAVYFLGRDISRLDPAARCRAGIGRTYQIPHPFSGMTVFENLLVGAVFGAGLHESMAAKRAIAVLEQTGLAAKANKLAGGLTLLDRKRLELAKALATNPKLLLLDEIAGGLTEHEVHDLIAIIKSIRAEGVAIIWIEHVVHALLAVVDRLTVINFGRLLAEGEPAAVMANPEVQAVYLGVEVT